MPLVVERFVSIEIPSTLVKLRTHAAMVRALLDELERAAPLSDRPSATDVQPSLAEQLAEELARLGCRMLECAAMVSVIATDLNRGQA
jgi:hypothetical protein